VIEFFYIFILGLILPPDESPGMFKGHIIAIYGSCSEINSFEYLHLGIMLCEYLQNLFGFSIFPVKMFLITCAEIGRSE
jgi:hypothetical protein